MKFTELNLPSTMLQALQKMGFEDLTPVQEITYPLIMSGRDVCALAETGSGKTSACAIPLVQKVDPSVNAIQGLVIVPTRELCIQYMDEIASIAEGSNVIAFPAFGGADKGSQAAKIRHSVHILVATPGRLIDFMMDGVVKLSQIKCLVLDEADELLAVGFYDDIKFIMSCILHEHQTLLFSATMNEDIQKLANDALNNPEHITLIKEQKSPVSIVHSFCYVAPPMKDHEALKIIETHHMKQCLLFCNSRHRVEKLHAMLKRSLDKVDYLHAGLSQDKRSIIFDKFKRGRIQYLIATDVAGRGLDFSNVTHVINLDFPDSEEQYMHRTGRVGRMGRDGHAITFITRRDLPTLKQLLQAKNIDPQWIGSNPFLKPNRNK